MLTGKKVRKHDQAQSSGSRLSHMSGASGSSAAASPMKRVVLSVLSTIRPGPGKRSSIRWSRAWRAPPPPAPRHNARSPEGIPADLVGEQEQPVDLGSIANRAVAGEDLLDQCRAGARRAGDEDRARGRLALPGGDHRNALGAVAVDGSLCIVAVGIAVIRGERLHFLPAPGKHARRFRHRPCPVRRDRPHAVSARPAPSHAQPR